MGISVFYQLCIIIINFIIIIIIIIIIVADTRSWSIAINPWDSMYSNPRIRTHVNAPIIKGIKLVYPELSHWWHLRL